MPPDAGQHLGCDPALEALRRRQLAGENQTVQAGFVDDSQLLRAARGVAFCYSLVFLIHALRQCVSGVAVAENLGHVSADEIRLAVYGQRAHRAELVIVKNLTLVHPFIPP